jgi:WD40 repeat protein
MEHKTGEILNSITSDDYHVQSLTYSPDGRYLVVSYSGSPRIIFWDLENMSTERIISTPFIIRDLDFSDDGRIFAGISDRTGHIIIWDTATGEVQRTFYALHGLFANMDLSPSGDFAGIRSSRMAIWNVSSGKKILDISSLPKNEGVNRFTCLKFSPETKYLATGIRISTTAPYYFSPDEFSRARRGNVNVDLLLSIGGTNPIFLWNFQDIEEGEYIESLWDVQHDLPLFWVIVLWAPLIAVSYFGLLVIYGIFRVRKAK